MNSELLYITRKLGYPSSFGTRAGLGNFLDQYPDGVYAETGAGAPMGWESAAVWFGGDSERSAARFEMMMSERNEMSRLFRTRVAGVLVLTFIYRLKSRMVTAIPIGGGEEPEPPTIDWWGLKLTMPEGGTVILRKNGNPNPVSLEVSTDGENWAEWELVGTDYTYNLQAGEKLCIRNTSATFVRFSTAAINYYQFIFNAVTYASGKITSLSCNNENDTELPISASYNFVSLFENNSHLITSPHLPTKRLPQRCYRKLFFECTNLTTVHTDMTDISALDCLRTWLSDVSPTGDFYCPSELTIPTGTSGIPSGWTRHDI